MTDELASAFCIWMFATIIPVGPALGAIIATVAGWSEGTWPFVLSTLVLGSTVITALVMGAFRISERRP